VFTVQPLRQVIPNVGKLTELRVLRLSGNNLQQIPATMGNLGQLRELHLGSKPSTPECWKVLPKVIFPPGRCGCQKSSASLMTILKRSTPPITLAWLDPEHRTLHTQH